MLLSFIQLKDHREIIPYSKLYNKVITPYRCINICTGCPFFYKFILLMIDILIIDYFGFLALSVKNKLKFVYLPNEFDSFCIVSQDSS